MLNSKASTIGAIESFLIFSQPAIDGNSRLAMDKSNKSRQDHAKNKIWFLNRWHNENELANRRQTSTVPLEEDKPSIAYRDMTIPMRLPKKYMSSSERELSITSDLKKYDLDNKDLIPFVTKVEKMNVNHNDVSNDSGNESFLNSNYDHNFTADKVSNENSLPKYMGENIFSQQRAKSAELIEANVHNPEKFPLNSSENNIYESKSLSLHRKDLSIESNKSLHRKDLSLDYHDRHGHQSKIATQNFSKKFPEEQKLPQNMRRSSKQRDDLHSQIIPSTENQFDLKSEAKFDAHKFQKSLNEESNKNYNELYASDCPPNKVSPSLLHNRSKRVDLLKVQQSFEEDTPSTYIPMQKNELKQNKFRDHSFRCFQYEKRDEYIYATGLNQNNKNSIKNYNKVSNIGDGTPFKLSNDEVYDATCEPARRFRYQKELRCNNISNNCENMMQTLDCQNVDNNCVVNNRCLRSAITPGTDIFHRKSTNNRRMDCTYNMVKYKSCLSSSPRRNIIHDENADVPDTAHVQGIIPSLSHAPINPYSDPRHYNLLMNKSSGSSGIFSNAEEYSHDHLVPNDQNYFVNYPKSDMPSNNLSAIEYKAENYGSGLSLDSSCMQSDYTSSRNYMELNSPSYSSTYSLSDTEKFENVEMYNYANMRDGSITRITTTLPESSIGSESLKRSIRFKETHDNLQSIISSNKTQHYNPVRFDSEI